METENSKSKEGLIQSQIVMSYILQGPISKFRSAGKSDKSVETLLHDIASFLLVVLNLISSFRDGEHLMFLGEYVLVSSSHLSSKITPPCGFHLYFWKEKVATLVFFCLV